MGWVAMGVAWAGWLFEAGYAEIAFIKDTSTITYCQYLHKLSRILT